MKKLWSFFIFLLLINLSFLLCINLYMYLETREFIDPRHDFQADCILILGAGVKNNQPTPMLKDRLLTGIRLYHEQKASKIVVSGDHHDDDYNEVGVMRDFLLQHDIPSSDIFVDHKGYSTYESLYRIQNVFHAKKVIIVTQDYHLYRALFIAKELNLDAVGYSARLQSYSHQYLRELREIIAREKDFFYCCIRPQIEINESYSLTDDGTISNTID